MKWGEITPGKLPLGWTPPRSELEVRRGRYDINTNIWYSLEVVLRGFGGRPGRRARLMERYRGRPRIILARLSRTTLRFIVRPVRQSPREGVPHLKFNPHTQSYHTLLSLWNTHLPSLFVTLRTIETINIKCNYDRVNCVCKPHRGWQCHGCGIRVWILQTIPYLR
jgi:hypothetical protein